MRSLVPALAALLVLAITTPAFSQERVAHHLVHVTVADGAALSRLVALDLDLAACQHATGGFPRTLDVIAADGDLARLRTAGFRSVVAIPRLEEHRARELAAFGPFVDGPNPPLGQGAMGGHWTLAQMESILDNLAQNHPTICSAKVSIGQSVEGRDLWMVKISDNVGVDEGEPEALFDALHHAREPVSMEATVTFMDWLCSNYGTDPLATFLVNERELYFVPCVNPDGYEYNYQQDPGGGGLWRKNRRANSGGSFGVDLNRNYDIGWNAPNGGNSSSQTSGTYRGTAPFSEPEVAAMVGFAATRSFTHVFTVHTYTDVLLSPYGYQPGAVGNQGDYDALGEALTRDNGIADGPCYFLLYPLAGGALDHHHEVHGSYAWLPELGRADEGGFWPDPTNTVNIVNRHQPMFRTMAAAAGSWVELADLTAREGTPSNGNGSIEPGERFEVSVSVTNGGVLGTLGDVVASVATTTPGVTVVAASANLGVVAPFGLASDPTFALRLDLAVGSAPRVVDLDVTLTWPGGTRTQTRRLLLGAYAQLVADDMERDRGLERAGGGTATTGLWERGTPQQTSSGGTVIQPGAAAGGTLCWVTDPLAGSSVGNRDVDGGFTDLWTPTVDLSAQDAVRLSCARWYGESSANDPFEVAVSRDGGGLWETLLSDSTPTGAWTAWSADVPPPYTADMRFRFRAQDLSPSLVEAAIDDLVIEGLGPDGTLTAWSSGVRGSTLRLAATGRTGTTWFFAGPVAPTPVLFPGVGGAFGVDLAGLIYLPTAANDPLVGSAAIDVTLPSDPGLVGVTFALQGAWIDGSAVTFTSTASVTLR